MPFSNTEMPGKIQSLLAERGVRMTGQRRAILKVIETAKKHLGAGQILRRARELDPSIDRSTVYRTIGLLKQHGLIDELDLMHIEGEAHYYERKSSREHIHIACLRCGKITEYASELFDSLKEQVARECGYRIAVTRLEIGGYCPRCCTSVFQAEGFGGS